MTMKLIVIVDGKKISAKRKDIKEAEKAVEDFFESGGFESKKVAVEKVEIEK